MGARNITESPTNLIIAQIQNNIVQALNDVNTQRGDSSVNLTAPSTQSYFYYSPAINFKAPGIFVLARSVDFSLTRGQNFVDAVGDFMVAAIIEERTPERLAVSGWRYQDALHSLLHGIELFDSINDVQIIMKVKKARYSGTDQIGDETSKTFRKEIALDLDVEIYENL